MVMLFAASADAEAEAASETIAASDAEEKKKSPTSILTGGAANRIVHSTTYSIISDFFCPLTIRRLYFNCWKPR